MPMTAAERQKKYIEKLKRENPEKYEEKRKKHLQKVKDRQKKTNDLTDEEKLIQIERKKNAAKAKQNNLSREQNTEKETLKRNIELLKHNSILENKVLLLNRKIKTLQKTMKRYRLKVHDLQNKIKAYEDKVLLMNEEQGPIDESNLKHKSDATPLTKAVSFIDEVLPSTSHENREKVKKKLFELNILSDSLKTEYLKANTNITKETLRKIIDNEITNKYKMKNKLSVKLGINRIRRRPIITKLRKQRIHAEEIKAFFCRDDISRATAGKQETKTKNKNKKQKRYLLDSMLSLHKKYRQEGGKLSYTTFVRLKPFYVLRPNINDRNTCACTKHSNLSFKATKLKLLHIINTDNLSELVKMIVCDYNSKDCMYSTCMSCKDKMFELELNYENKSQQTSWWKWVTKKHSYTKHTKEGPKEMTTKKIKKEFITSSVKQLVSEFKQELLLFKKHYFNIAHQYKEFKNCIDNLQKDEVAILCDFSENYTCKLSEQVQSAHFGSSQNQFSLHTGVLYTKDNQPISFCTISPSTAHDPGAIWAHLNPIIDYTKTVCPLLRVIHIFSDGPATQYRQKKNFFLLSKIIGDSVIEYATWNYFEASHGKGPADGVGGAIKRKLDQMVAYGKDIPDSKAAYDLLKSCQSKVTFFYITEESIRTLQDLIPLNLVAVAGTLNLHQIITTNEYATIYYRDITCFCNLASKGLCEFYDLKLHNLIEKKSDTVLRKRKLKGTRKNIVKKRKQVSETESSTNDSEESNNVIFYANTDIDEDIDSDSETDIEAVTRFEKNKQIISDRQTNKQIETEKQLKEEVSTKDDVRQKENIEPGMESDTKGNSINVRASEIKILQSQQVNIMLDETTGIFKLMLTSPDQKTDVPDQNLNNNNITIPERPFKDRCKQQVKEETKKIETSEMSAIRIEKEEGSIHHDNSDDMVKENESEVVPYPCISSEHKIFNDIVRNPKTGEFILAKFPNQRNKEYRFVCRIEDLSHDKIVVQGFKSKKKKTIYAVIKNDISIIEKDDIVEFLSQPRIEGNNYIFPTDIDVREI